MISDSRSGPPCGKGCHLAPVPADRPIRIKIHPRQDAKQVAEARALGLDISRIVDEALIRETAAERIRRQAGEVVNREEDDPGR